MTTRDIPWPAGTPCWVAISVPDVSAATAFYGAVLGWSFIDGGGQSGRYYIAQTGGRDAAAVGPVVQAGQPSVWTVYLATDDADETAGLITENGGTLLGGPTEIPGTARTGIALDPTGGLFGIWQSLEMIGAGVVAEAGSLTWTDVRLADPVAGRAFYSAVFGYSYQAIPDAPAGYATVHVTDGDPVAGIVRTPDGVPSHWLTYFAVADVDAAVAVAARAGAAVLMPAEETGSGRIAVLTDPFGATFAVHREPDAQ